MLSFVAALLQADPQTHDSEAKMQERARDVFAVADINKNGKLSKQEIYNYFADVRVRFDLALRACDSAVPPHTRQRAGEYVSHCLGETFQAAQQRSSSHHTGTVPAGRERLLATRLHLW